MTFWKDRKTFWLTSVSFIAILLGLYAWSERSWRETVESALRNTLQLHDHTITALYSEQERAEQLNQMLLRKTGEVKRLAQRLQEDAEIIQSLKEENTAKEKQISKLQTELILAVDSFGDNPNRSDTARELERIAVSLSEGEDNLGRIVQIHPEWEFVVLDLGWDNVVIGDVLGVYRDEELVAEVQVERVQEKAAAARVLPKYDTINIALNDRVFVQ